MAKKTLCYIVAIVAIFSFVINSGFKLYDAYNYNMDDLPEGVFISVRTSMKNKYFAYIYEVDNGDRYPVAMRVEIREPETQKKWNIFWTDDKITEIYFSNQSPYLITINGLLMDVRTDNYDYRNYR